MVTVGAFAAKTHLVALLERVERVEEVLITRHGKTVARLVPVATADRARGGGDHRPAQGAARRHHARWAVVEGAARRRPAMSFVVDCSVALAWCFEDEASAHSDALRERLRDGGAVVPALWHLEIGNVLLQAERRGRITAAGVAARIALLRRLPLTTDEEATGRAFAEILAVARAQRLTTCDATYLELAARRGLPLATKDGELQLAAGQLGVEVLAA